VTDKTPRLLALLRDVSAKLALYWQRNGEYVGGVEHSALQRRIANEISHLSACGDAWAPSGADYDRHIHQNRDAAAWADFFVATFPGLADKRDLMLGWFANAMMAMHDSLKAEQRDACGDAVAWMTEDGERVVPKRTKDAGSNLGPPSALAIYSVPLYRHPSPLPEPEVRELVEAAKALSKDHKHAMALIADSEVPVVSEVSKRVDTALSAPRLLDYLRGQQP
jgi:hypothetical protein